MESRQESYWLPKGSLLQGKYRIMDVIAEGGMGIVYLGFDTVLQMEISIKEYFPRRFVMRNHGEKEIHTYKGEAEKIFREGLEKFMSEARALARFHELDSVVLARDFFCENNTAYIVMSHIKGDNIKKWVEKNGPMPAEQVLEVMRPILESLREIHKEGLLHRDISPDNIILDKKRKAVLVDFGTARITDKEETQTMTVFFKRGYSAEEQYTEKSKEGPYTDIYALCTTIYFMLTGVRPEESVRRMVRDEVKPLTKYKDVLLSKGVKEAIVRGMEVRPENRYDTIEELYTQLYEEEEISSFGKKYKKILLGSGVLLILCVATDIWQSERDISNSRYQNKKPVISTIPTEKATPTETVFPQTIQTPKPKETAMPKATPKPKKTAMPKATPKPKKMVTPKATVKPKKTASPKGTIKPKDNEFAGNIPENTKPGNDEFAGELPE